MSLPKKPLLIFDLDGTLIDSVPDLADSVNAMLTELNKPRFSEDTIRNWVGNGASMLVKRALTASEPTITLSNERLETALSIFFAHYSAHVCVRTVPYAGVDEGLKKLKQMGYTLAIATNKPAQFVEPILAALHWQALFSLWLGGDSLPEKKPDPAPLLYICDKLQFSPEQTLMIGDSKNDILAGKNAGIDTLGLSYGYNYGEDIRAQNPTHAFDTFIELVNFLSRL